MKKIKILIAEDNESKIKSIVQLFDSLSIDIESKYVLTPAEVIRHLKTFQYDLLLLDMSLPAYSEESHSIGSLSGKQILQTMKHKKLIIPTIVLTQWDIFGHHDNIISLDNLTNELINKFSPFLLGVVFWDSSSKLWEKEISNHITGISND